MSLPVRPGMTVPLPGPLHSHREKLAELADLGYTDIWSAEADGAEALPCWRWQLGAATAARHGASAVHAVASLFRPVRFSLATRPPAGSRSASAAAAT
jgi:hypothetical protein